MVAAKVGNLDSGTSGRPFCFAVGTAVLGEAVFRLDFRRSSNSLTRCVSRRVVFSRRLSRYRKVGRCVQSLCARTAAE